MKNKFLFIGWLLLCISVRSAAISVVVTQADSLAWRGLDRASTVRLSEIACQQGIDTTALFVEAWDQLCRQALKSHLPFHSLVPHERDTMDEALSSDSLERRRVKCVHLFHPVSQMLPPSAFERLLSQMDALHYRLNEEKASVDWNQEDEQLCVDTTWIIPSRQPKQMEESLCQLAIGEWSQPLVTPMGIHLIKVLDVDTTRGPRVAASPKWPSAEEIKRLKERHHFQPQHSQIDKLLKSKPVQGELFSVNGQSYGVAQYQCYAESHPSAVKPCFEAFVIKTLLDTEAGCFYAELKLSRSTLSDTLAAPSSSLAEVRDSLLTSILLAQTVRPHLCNESELEAWYLTHKEQFSKPVFHGLILHCVDKKQGRALRKFLKNLPEQEREHAIELLFAENPQEAPMIEKGTFLQGSHPFVDALMFRGAEPLPYPNRPYTQLVGHKTKAPENYQEVRHDVLTHYGNYLVKQLIEQCIQAEKVEK